MLTVTQEIQIPEHELRFTFARSSGPGGQNVNKVNSKAVLHWDVAGNKSLPETVRIRFMNRHASKINADGVLVLASDRFRHQPGNIQDCLEKLRRLVLEVATPPKIRKATKPKYAAKKRRLESKTKKGETKKNRRRVVY
jgi:ribosome-associated protein